MANADRLCRRILNTEYRAQCGIQDLAMLTAGNRFPAVPSDIPGTVATTGQPCHSASTRWICGARWSPAFRGSLLWQAPTEPGRRISAPGQRCPSAIPQVPPPSVLSCECWWSRMRSGWPDCSSARCGKRATQWTSPRTGQRVYSWRRRTPTGPSSSMSCCRAWTDSSSAGGCGSRDGGSRC